MFIRYDPDEHKTEVSRRVCAFHEVNPGESFAGCTCSTAITSIRRSDDEIREIKRARQEAEDDHILAMAEIIKANRKRRGA